MTLTSKPTVQLLRPMHDVTTVPMKCINTYNNEGHLFTYFPPLSSSDDPVEATAGCPESYSESPGQ